MDNRKKIIAAASVLLGIIICGVYYMFTSRPDNVYLASKNTETPISETGDGDELSYASADAADQLFNSLPDETDTITETDTPTEADGFTEMDNPTESPADTEDLEVPKISVHVIGAVNSPGVYQLDDGSRVIDAVEAAGGLTDEADGESMNMAHFVYDTQQIKIYKIGEELPSELPTESPPELSPELLSEETAVPEIQQSVGSETVSPETPNNANEPVESDTLTSTNAAPETTVPIPETPAPTEDAGEWKDGKININKASKSTLMSLPGIGETIAAYIIEYRQANGGFNTITEIKNVERVGDKTYEKIKDLITI